jgi:hypothetical protein
MWKHLWTDGPIPPDYIDLLLCERFGWTVEDLYATDGETIEKFLAMWTVEQAVRKAKEDPTGRRNANLPS